ncbi:MAG: HAD family hydrolase [Solirubrobacteraceae bacterium]
MGRVTAARAVLLDALGTLVELEPPGPALRQELRARCGIQVSRAAAERAMATEILFYRANLREGRDRDALAGLRRRCTAVLAGALGEPVSDLQMADLQGVLLASLRFRAFPEVPTALARMRARGVRLVVVSNWDWSLHEMLARTGLASQLSGAISSAELGVGKPSPAIFRHALTLAGVPADAAIHVGDTPSEDVAGAQAAGIEPVLIARRGKPKGPRGVRTVRSLTEVDELAA